MLRAGAHFSLEQAVAINEFLGHSAEESRLFLLLVQAARAGTMRLRQRFDTEIQGVVRARLALKNRLGVRDELDGGAQATYYSAWYYAATHALVSIEGFQSPVKIARRLGISAEKAQAVLGFLLSTGLLVKEGNELKIGVARIHLPHDSPLIAKHHINWRLEAVRSLEQDRAEDLHYSSAVSISAEDARRVREMLVKAIGRCKEVVRDSKEEEVHALCLDFFSVGRG